MDRWEKLRKDCMNCRNCSLSGQRKNVVFGDGAHDAEILLIGEGPGQREDEQGIPFVGPAGQLLDDMLEMIGLDRTKVYIANIVKCRPPNNRDPLNVEQEACIGWLRCARKLSSAWAVSPPKPLSARTSGLHRSTGSGSRERTSGLPRSTIPPRSFGTTPNALIPSRTSRTFSAKSGRSVREPAVCPIVNRKKNNG